MGRLGRSGSRRQVAIVLAVVLAFSGAGTGVASAKAKAKAKTTKKVATKKVVTTKAPSKAAPATPSANANKGTILLGTEGFGTDTRGNKTLEDTRKVAEAWQDGVNAAGGINGYKVKVIYKDTKSDSALTLNATKALDAAGVLAIVGQTVYNTGAVMMQVADDKKLPVLGGTGWFVEARQSPMYFEVQADHFAGNYGVVAAANQAGAKVYRHTYCVELVACSANEGVMKWATAKLGMKFSSQAVSSSKADFTAECISAKNDGVEFLQSEGGALAQVVRDCSRQNYHPIWGQGNASGPSLMGNIQGERYTNPLYELGIFNNFPELNEFKKLMHKTDITDDLVTQTPLQTFMGFKMAEKVIAKLSGPNPTRADFLQAIYSIKGETLDGLLAPKGIDYSIQKTPGKHFFNDCWTTFSIVDGAFKALDSTGRIAKTAADNWQCGSGLYNDGVPAVAL
jgi:branched-chain amino acid transport system substrate-binding protein